MQKMLQQSVFKFLLTDVDTLATSSSELGLALAPIDFIGMGSTSFWLISLNNKDQMSTT